MQRARYDDEFRQRAVALSEEVGTPQAAKQLGVSQATLRSWRTRAGVAALHRETTQAAVEANRLRWEERRSAMVHEIGEIADLALSRVRSELGDDGKLRDAKDAATTMAILVDKAQLLSGGSTSRFGTDTQRAEVVADARERALRLVG